MNRMNPLITLIGCGKMGSAMLRGWLADDDLQADFAIVEPFHDHLGWTAAYDNVSRYDSIEACAAVGRAARIVVLAVKPQMMDEAIAGLGSLAGPDTGYLSIAAGIPTAWFHDRLGDQAVV
ncbi:MAG: pyrroline-5-carboxylate reductase, partial [Rhodospirillaceae bacterium]|nr:pyrroline-5-carboxylate reductase [Rhodospirillaceae bacterium]